jgi:antitoxin (DNA-binding transcriptional repressor) of toxin-antitoxin stability system
MEETMRLPVSEARRRLPELVRQVRADAGTMIQITVHNKVAAELRAALPEPEPGAAAKALLALVRRLRRRRGPKSHVSSNVKAHLYDPDGGHR